MVNSALRHLDDATCSALRIEHFINCNWISAELLVCSGMMYWGWFQGVWTPTVVQESLSVSSDISDHWCTSYRAFLLYKKIMRGYDALVNLTCNSPVVHPNSVWEKSQASVFQQDWGVTWKAPQGPRLWDTSRLTSEHFLFPSCYWQTSFFYVGIARAVAVTAYKHLHEVIIS